MNKGFTLIELLAVIIVLMSLLLVTSIIVSPVVDDSKENMSDIQIKSIENAAKSYYIKEGIDSSHMDLDEARSCVTVDELINKGYLNKDEIVDPESNESVLGSVKIIYRANNYSYEYQNKTCSNLDRGIICDRVKETNVGNVPEGNYELGDKYICEVKPGVKYNFYIFNTDDDKIDLIMDRNICEDGKVATEENKCLIPWYEVFNDNSQGPITAMVYLHNATKYWTNVLPLEYFYEDNLFHQMEYGYNSFESLKGILNIVSLAGKKIIMGTKEEPVRARMPIHSGIWNEGHVGVASEKGEVLNANEENLYLYDNLDSSDWLRTIVSRPPNNISGIYGYWTISADATDELHAWIVGYNGLVVHNYVNIGDSYGVRPIITLTKSQLE